MTTSLPATIPPDIEKTLEGVFQSHGYQKEAMVQEYLRVRRKAQDEGPDDADAEFDVSAFLSKDETRRKAAIRLANDATSPVVSRETQMAVLKQLIQDYFRGKKRPGLGALTVMKAVELLNKMSGYEKPMEVNHQHEHKVAVMPIIAKPFEGSLPPLRVLDVKDEDGIVDAVVTSDSGPAQSNELTPEDF